MQDHRNLGHVASPAEIASLASLVARKLASPPVFVGAAQPRVVSATTASAAAQHAASGLAYRCRPACITGRRRVSRRKPTGRNLQCSASRKFSRT